MDDGTNTILLFCIQFHAPFVEEWNLTMMLNLLLRTLFKSENSLSMLPLCMLASLAVQYNNNI